MALLRGEGSSVCVLIYFHLTLIILKKKIYINSNTTKVCMMFQKQRTGFILTYFLRAVPGLHRKGPNEMTPPPVLPSLL